MTEVDVGAWSALVEWLSKVLASAAVVLGAIWKWLERMITRKVKEQIEVAMDAITATTSKAIDALRHEIHETDKKSEARIERLGDRLSERIDKIMSQRSDR